MNNREKLKNLAPVIVIMLIVIGGVSISRAWVVRFIIPQAGGFAFIGREGEQNGWDDSSQQPSGDMEKSDTLLDGNNTYLIPIDDIDYDHPISQLPIVHLQFEGNTKNADGGDFASGNNLEYLPGVSGMAASFEEEGAFVEFPSDWINLLAGGVSFWAYLESYPTYRRKCVFFDHRTGRAGGKDTSFIQMYIQDDSLGIGMGSIRDHSEGIKMIELHRWTFYTLVWHAGNFVVYIDGEEVYTGSYEGLEQRGVASLGNSGIYVQTQSRKTIRPLTGMLDEFKLWNRAIDAEEVSEEYRKITSLAVFRSQEWGMVRSRKRGVRWK